MSFVDPRISSSLKATTVNLFSYVSRCNHVRVPSAMLSQELHLYGTCGFLLPKTELLASRSIFNSSISEFDKELNFNRSFKCL